jgi:hypothetical protein
MSSPLPSLSGMSPAPSPTLFSTPQSKLSSSKPDCSVRMLCNADTDEDEEERRERNLNIIL